MASAGILFDRIFHDLIMYYNEYNRLATFKSWPFDESKECSKTKMAEAGFIFTGSSRDPDSVECFFCGKKMDGWEEHDNPFEEHYSHAKHCEFAQMCKPQRQWTVAEHLKLMEVYERRQIALQCATVNENMRKDLADIQKQILRSNKFG